MGTTIFDKKGWAHPHHALKISSYIMPIYPNLGLDLSGATLTAISNGCDPCRCAANFIDLWQREWTGISLGFGAELQSYNCNELLYKTSVALQ
jgi:hypothetical protein